jgi:voltage-gated potassium channel
VAKPRDRVSKAFDIAIVTLILLNVVAVILETVDSIAAEFEDVLYFFELCSLVVFSVEYVLRIWSCTASERYSHPLTGRVRFALRPLLIIDLIAILPFCIPLLLPMDLRFLRAFRFFWALQGPETWKIL